MFRKQKKCLAFAILICGCGMVIAMARVALAQQKAQNNLRLKSTLFEQDTRLRRRVTITIKGITTEKLLRRLSESTRVSLKVDAPLSDDVIFASCREIRLSEAMDAIAVLQGGTWEKVKDVYVLRAAFRWEKDFFPDSEGRRALTKAGLKFVDAADDLPLPLLSQLTNKGDEYLAPFKRLPSHMQIALKEMLDANQECQSSEMVGKKLLRPIDSDNISSCKVSLQKEPGDGGTVVYTVGMGNEQGGLTMSFSNYTRAKQNFRSYLSGPNVYAPQAETVSRAEILRQEQFQQMVSLNIETSPWEKTIALLSDKVPSVNFVTFGNTPPWDKRRVSVPPMTLHKALDRLLEIYPYRHWQMRPSGIVVLAWGRK